ncbi:Morphology and auto-aggregation control protein [Raoultella terrigena]|uniref:Morphology and auto-aggregation control protein n=1 Tax=Raoultella terrigena TaxID=577 RepID=A0A3P8IUJ2_RAOTE|nr:Morphology and auto-aggregation control protein [Raoultella terrigena]
MPSVSSLLFPLLPQTLAETFPRLRVEFHDRANDALVRELLSGQIDFAVGAIDSSIPAELQVYPLREDPFVAVLHGDDPLAGQPHLLWKLLAGRDIAVFSKGNIQRLVGALAESHRLTLNKRYQVDYIETLYGLVRSRLAIAILPELYTTHLCDPHLKIAQLQQPALSRTVALMRGPQTLPPLIESSFALLLSSLRE